MARHERPTATLNEPAGKLDDALRNSVAVVRVRFVLDTMLRLPGPEEALPSRRLAAPAVDPEIAVAAFAPLHGANRRDLEVRGVSFLRTRTDFYCCIERCWIDHHCA